MAEFKLERFKYNWKGTWQAGTAYKRDDVVRINGNSYVCVVAHTASSAFRTDLTAILAGSIPPQPQPRWTVMTSGRSFIGDWTSGTNYNLGDVVKYNGSLWLCAEPHLASNFATNISNWSAFARTATLIGNWASGVTYAPGAVVRYGGNSYKCIVAHTSQATLETNISAWAEYYQGDRVRGDWTPSVRYLINDLVKYGGSIYRCTESHTAQAGALDDTRFIIKIIGTQSEGEWDPLVRYNVGDVVNYRGFIYYAIRNNFETRPYDANPSASQSWILVSRTYNFIGEWSVTGEYNPGDIVLRGGNLYLALKDIGVGQQEDGSTIDYLADDTWELLVPGKSFKTNWSTNTDYNVGDVVYFKGSAYTCNFSHESSTLNFPGDNGSGYDYWDILIQAGREGGLREAGDILTYGLSREIDNDGSTVFDDSTIGDVRVPIGAPTQALSVSSDLEVFWRNIAQDAESVFVARNGIDAEGRGTFQNPFRSVRYAAEYVEDTYPPLTPVIIRVGTGKYEEIGPIIVPAGCAVNGDELRSTTIVANPPLSEYQNDYQSVSDYLTRLESILLDVLSGIEIIPSPGNTEPQITENLVPVRDADGNIVFDTARQPILIDTFPETNLAGATRIAELLSDYKDYIEWATQGGLNPPTIIGSNILNTASEIINAGEGLFLNRKFIQEELLAYAKSVQPTRTVSDNRIKNDIYALIRGIRRDTKYSGNYATIIAARRYANAVSGSQFDSMFLMRDSTGLRDLTTEGLRGTLNPPGVFDLYQKPTGGSCVSLDPGWGPDDQRVWIINRSPYIQGVTNIGTGCVGQKVDGALHNGGNRSMTSNDFTQVLSDGIGAWVTNNARAELVSVFTYYCQIGYFAENGGIIRATNGNNSYGRYGSIADGADATEIPQTATLFNRNNEAQVLSSFAGGDTDTIFAFEYTNAGEEYTQASAEIIGAGANASVEYTDFRDGALFEARLVNLQDSGSEGGAGYLTRQGSAQETLDASSFIKLSSNDVTQFVDEILGMRLIITAGLGAGQYGYVTAFNFGTRTVTVRRESDGELGWDHIIPGTPIEPSLDLTTRYRFEPRISVSSPGFAALNYDLITDRTYVDAAFGGSTETYTNISGSSSVLWTDNDRNAVTVRTVVSSVAVQFDGIFLIDPRVPFNIVGKLSGTTFTVTAITANADSYIEVDGTGNTGGFIEGEQLGLVYSAGSGGTLDAPEVPAVFSITRAGDDYTASLTNPGAGYDEGDVIVFPGTLFGGTTPANDLQITVTDVSSDSTNSIQAFTSAGRARQGRFISLTNSQYARWSDDAINWTETNLSFSGDYRRLISGNNRFIALANNENRVSVSLTGQTWSTVNLPVRESWTDGVYGGGRFVIVANNTNNVLTSTNGTTFSVANIPSDTVGDSTVSQWTQIAYGKGKFVVVSANDRATATSTNGTSWTRHDTALPEITVGDDWSIVSLAYGNNRFIILDSQGRTAYSFDGVVWYRGTTAPGSLTWSEIKYSQGVFFAIGLDGVNPTNVCATTEDGLVWDSRTLSTSRRWGALTFGKTNGSSRWILLASSTSTGGINHVRTGARAKLRANVLQGKFENVKIWDPGSGYLVSNPPVLTITDPNATTVATTSNRLGNGVLAQPDFVNRGVGYRTTTSRVLISGNGYADIIPEANEITLAGLVTIPNPGVQIRITGVLDPLTEIEDDLRVFNGAIITDLGDDGSGNGTRLVRLTISPRVRNEYNLAHGTAVTLRSRYSQCRITGHDFLDIGTGNFEQTNYPEIYAGGNFFTASPENEVLEQNGGRVFYTSTDQDGNFRTGELFAVSQSTGTVTISAEFFDLDGLSELALGGVRLGGSGTVVNEFSTDPTFSADSNNVIPTQRAITTFLANRLSVGGENLEVNRLQAGRVRLGGEDSAIENAAQQYVLIPVDVIFDGTYEVPQLTGPTIIRQTNISGTIVSQMLFLKQLDEGMQ